MWNIVKISFFLYFVCLLGWLMQNGMVLKGSDMMSGRENKQTQTHTKRR